MMLRQIFSIGELDARVRVGGLARARGRRRSVCVRSKSRRACIRRSSRVMTSALVTVLGPPGSGRARLLALLLHASDDGTEETAGGGAGPGGGPAVGDRGGAEVPPEGATDAGAPTPGTRRIAGRLISGRFCDIARRESGRNPG